MLTRCLWLALGLLCLVGSGWLFLPEVRNYQGLVHARAALEQETRRVDSRIAELQTQERRFGADPAFVERTARQDGMVKSNEIVFKVVREEPPAPARP